MPPTVEQLRPHLHSFDFRSLFVEGLGWNHHYGQQVQVTADGYDYTLQPLAEKAEFVLYRCDPAANGEVPPYPMRRKIEHQVAKLAFEHMIVFVDAAQTTQVWQWVKREPGAPASCREQPFRAGHSGDSLLQRLRTLAFALDEEDGLSIPVVASRVRQAMDVERLTKRFYERFKKELAAFQGFIDGIAAQGDREWYASLMLNRMMFVYFVQKQGFLDGDPHYLRTRLTMAQLQQGKDGNGRFHRFYRFFLRRLFHEGLGQTEAERAPELAALLGKVPFLNGGLFDVHDLERDYPEIDIPDEAFAKVFDFFDGYRWHLDERPNRADNEINPDVLGYIFEKFVNQKQMGAYYTKEDITGYISRNTVIPFLFDAARKHCPVAFQPGSGVWRLLQDEPDRYIYPAVGHGMAWAYSPDADPRPLEQATELPAEIAAALNDVSLRGAWNHPAPSAYALPTETWREVVARRRRYAEVRSQLACGAVHEINDLITLNVDIQRFALDVIVHSEGPELLRAFWHAISAVSVLDPTCGSGAFLFAALNILEPLYSACLEGMRGFITDLNRTNRPHHPRTLHDFRDVLEQVDRHPSVSYFILKSIVLNNLYGVDIMEEAVEICKLRLFLKLVAQLDRYEQIEPLPDIDFNIRAGNTLVGFTSLDAVRRAITMEPDGQHRALYGADHAMLARIDESAEITSRAFDQFRQQQTALGGEVTVADKANLRRRLDALDSELNRLLAVEYRIDPHNGAAYTAWRDSHQPFHWFVEFYNIMSTGGFDAVIGNPPYLETKQVAYATRHFESADSRAIHAMCIERSVQILGKRGSVSMIVPLALSSTQRMKAVQDILEQEGRSAWYANFGWRPAKLFDTVNRALTIFTTTFSSDPASFSTGYQMWTSECRDTLFDRIAFTMVPRKRPSFWIPKFGCDLETAMLEKVMSIPTSISHWVSPKGHRVFCRTTGGLYWKVFTDFAPVFTLNSQQQKSSRQTSFALRESSYVQPIIAALSSDLFWWWYTLTSNLRDLNPADFMNFPLPDTLLSDATLRNLANLYLAHIAHNSEMKVRDQRQTGRTTTQSFKIQYSKSIIEDIDRVLLKHYGLTDEELDFIVNYDIKFRMGSASSRGR